MTIGMLRFYKNIKRNFLTFIFIFILLLSLLLISPLSLFLNTSKTMPLSTFETHGTISIDGNGELDAFPNHTGLGTSGSPYIIENYEIDAGGFLSAIEIKNTDKYLIIRNCTLINAGSAPNAGIYLDNSTNIIIDNCTIDNSQDYGIFLNNSENIEIVESIVNNTYNGYGIRGEFCTNLNFTKNEILNSRYGSIHIYDTNHSLYQNNYISTEDISTSTTGFYIDNTYKNTILNNTLFLSSIGASLRYADSSKIINNTILNCTNDGINNYRSDHSQILNNTIKYCDVNSYEQYISRNCTIFDNTLEDGDFFVDIYEHYRTPIMDDSNTLDGKTIYLYANQTGLQPENFTNAAQIFLINCNNSVIADSIFNNTYTGVFLSHSYNNTIANSTFGSPSKWGIFLSHSNNNTVINCTIEAAEEYGIYFSAADNNTIQDSFVRDCTDNGIRLLASDECTLRNNTIYDCGLCAIYLTSSHLNTIYDNDVLFHPNDMGISLINSNNNTVNNNYIYEGNDGVHLEGADYNEIFDNSIDDFNNGIEMSASDSNWNTIYKNNITNSYWMGIELNAGSNNNITQNNCSNNGWYGIRLYESGGLLYDNLIYLNTFQNNENGQAYYYVTTGTGNKFNNGSMGNYYSDYRPFHPTAEPVPPENLTWNEPYLITSIYDDYPLVSPYGLNWPPPPAITHGTFIIDGNDELDNFQNKSGEGTQASPYIIENHTINSQETRSCIEIRNTDKYLIIRNCTLSNSSASYAGVYLDNCSNVKIENCTIDNNQGYGIFINNSNYIEIYDCKVNNTYNGHGIYIKLSTFINNTGNKILNSRHGSISIYYSNHSLYQNTYISTEDISTSTTGFYIDNSHNNTILNNTLFLSSLGINLRYADSSKIINNTILNCTNDGINNYRSNHVQILNNTIKYCAVNCIEQYISRNCTILENTLEDGDFFVDIYDFYRTPIMDDSNTLDGKTIYLYANQTGLQPENFTNAAQIFLINCNNSVIADSIFNNRYTGVFLSHSYNNTIANSTFGSPTKWGIFLSHSNNNTIINCTIEAAEEYGIYFSYADNNTIQDSFVRDCADNGIRLLASDECTLRNNTIYDCGLCAIYLTSSHLNMIYDNDVLFHPNDMGISLINSDNNTVNNNYIYEGNDGVHMEGADYNEIFDNTIDDFNNGIEMSASDSNWNTIYKNNITNSYWMGIELNAGRNNNITQNNCSNNGWYGIRLYESVGLLYDNLIYLNTLENNGNGHAYYYVTTGTGNSFDNGSLGNYYSDYQSYHPTASHNNVVWNESFLLDGATDYYPLVSPWGLNYTAQKPVLNPITPGTSKTGTINLTWDVIGIWAKFHIYRNTSIITSVSGLTPIATVFTTNYTDVITINDNYYYAIVTENDLGNGSISNCESVEVYIMPDVEILTPYNNSEYTDYDSTLVIVNVTDEFTISKVQLFINNSFITDLQYNGSLYIYNWSLTGYTGMNHLLIKANNSLGKINDTESVWVNVSSYIPPSDHADLNNVTITNSTGQQEENYTQGETLTYQATIRGDLGSGTYVVIAQTDDPILDGYLSYNDTVSVVAGQDTIVTFYFEIPSGVAVPTGDYTVYIMVWTDWAYNGGICVDYIVSTFTVE